MIFFLCLIYIDFYWEGRYGYGYILFMYYRYYNKCIEKCACLYSAGSYLKILIRQVDLKVKRVDALRQGPGKKVWKRVSGLTQPGQHVLHQDNLVTHLRLLRAHTKYSMFNFTARELDMK